LAQETKIWRGKTKHRSIALNKPVLADVFAVDHLERLQRDVRVDLRSGEKIAETVKV
jgi:hypothetical protein